MLSAALPPPPASPSPLKPSVPPLVGIGKTSSPAPSTIPATLPSSSSAGKIVLPDSAKREACKSSSIRERKEEEKREEEEEETEEEKSREPEERVRAKARSRGCERAKSWRGWCYFTFRLLILFVFIASSCSIGCGLQRWLEPPIRSL